MPGLWEALVGGTVTKDLLSRVEQQGYSLRIVPVERAADLRENIEASYRSGQFDDELYKVYLSGFNYDPPESLPGARSLVVLAERQLPVRLTFTWKDEPVPVFVPATYLHGGASDQKALDCLSAALAAAGFKAAPARLPKKLLAARSGLAAYGRNNITYVPGMGCYHRLSAFFTDLPCDEQGTPREEPATWREAGMLERCKNCRICLKQCPAGAIAPDRFLLHAEKCLVFHNEKPSDVPFPAWLDASWHNALVGCMLCQTACPENKAYAGQVLDGAIFTEEETDLLLAGVPVRELPAALVEKLENTDLVSILEVLPRNLRVLLGREK